MEVILKEEIRGFPRGLATLATTASRKQLDALRAKAEERSRKEKAAFQAMADKIQGVSLTIAAKVHDGEKLFGSIHASDVAQKLKEAGYDLDKKAVLLADPIKQLGMYTVKLQLHRDVEAKVKLWVISDESK